MDVEQVISDLVPKVAPGLDAALAEYLRGLVTAGEFDIALVTLIENAPRSVDDRFVTAVEKHYRGSGNHVEREALNAVKKYRELTVA